MYKRNFHEVSIAATGTTVTTTANTSTGEAIPVGSDGQRPRFLRFAATQPVHVRLGIGAQTALASDAMVVPGETLILAVTGATHWAAIDTGTVARVNVSPIEDS